MSVYQSWSVMGTAIVIALLIGFVLAKAMWRQP